MSEIDVAAVVAAVRAKFSDPNVELVSVQTRVGLFVLRSPTTAEYRRFRAEARDDTMSAEAFRNFFVVLCAHPSTPEVVAIIDRYSGVLLHDKVQNAVSWLTGKTDELQGKSWPAS